MFSILDGREKFYQWDKDRKLIVFDETITEVHFANCLCSNARVCEVYSVDGIHLVDVPNELLTEYMDIRVWGYDGEMTKHEAEFEVEKKTKPDDYIYTQSECWTVEKAVEEALVEAKESGDFKGDKGDKGDAGVINFIVVAELPEEGSGDSIYLLPNTSGENNQFDEYIFHEGMWEKIGSAGVDVNLDEYVKKTDYATSTTPGIVGVNVSNYGIGVNTAGVLYIDAATEAQIDAKTNARRPIVPSTVDYAVKKGLADNKEEWTDDEKTAARGLIGAASDEFATNASRGLVICGEGLSMASNGKLNVFKAKNEEIDAKANSFRPIVPNNLDYAVKLGMTDNQLEWTDEEKANARELLGAAGTELANYNKPGLVLNTSTYNGLFFNTDGSIGIWPAVNSYIDGRTSRCPITPTNLDYAVKSSMTTNALEWTEEEKTNARALLGAVGSEEIATSTTLGLVKAFPWYGILVDSKGALQLVNTTEAHIDSRGPKDSRVAITNQILDYAIKEGLTTNKLTLDDNDKLAASKWLGYPIIKDNGGVLSLIINGMEYALSPDALQPVITFTIDGVEYKAPQYTSQWDWVSTLYNTGGFYIWENDYSYWTNEELWAQRKGIIISPDEFIENNAEFTSVVMTDYPEE